MLLLSRVFIPSRITILPGVPPNELNLDESINGFDVRGCTTYFHYGYTLSSLSAFRETARAIFPNSSPSTVPSLSREDIFFFPIELPSFLPFVRFRFLIRRKKEGNEKEEEKEKYARYDPRFEEVNRICDFR